MGFIYIFLDVVEEYTMRIKLSIKSMTYKILTILAIVILAGCGFKPYSQKTLPEQLHTIYLQPGEHFGQFENNFKRSLKAAGVTVLDQVGSKNLILSLSPTTFTSDNSSIGGSIQARIYNLTFSVSFEVTDAKGKSIIDTQTITVTKGLTLNPNEVFSASNQVDIEKQSMQQEAISKIFNILSSPRTFELLAKV